MLEIEKCHRWTREECQEYWDLYRKKEVDMICSMPLFEYISERDGLYGLVAYIKKYGKVDQYDAKTQMAKCNFSGLVHRHIHKEIKYSGIDFALETLTEIAHILGAESAGSDYIFDLSLNDSDIYDQVLAYLKTNVDTCSSEYYESYFWYTFPDYIKREYGDALVDYLDIMNPQHRHFINVLIENGSMEEIKQIFKYPKMQSEHWVYNKKNLQIHDIFVVLGIPHTEFVVPNDEILLQKDKIYLSPNINHYSLELRAYFVTSHALSSRNIHEHKKIIDILLPEYSVRLAQMLPELLSSKGSQTHANLHSFWYAELKECMQKLDNSFKLYKENVESISFANYIKHVMASSVSELELFIN